LGRKLRQMLLLVLYMEIYRGGSSWCWVLLTQPPSRRTSPRGVCDPSSSSARRTDSPVRALFSGQVTLPAAELPLGSLNTAKASCKGHWGNSKAKLFPLGRAGDTEICFVKGNDHGTSEVGRLMPRRPLPTLRDSSYLAALQFSPPSAHFAGLWLALKLWVFGEQSSRLTKQGAPQRTRGTVPSSTRRVLVGSGSRCLQAPHALAIC